MTAVTPHVQAHSLDESAHVHAVLDRVSGFVVGNSSLEVLLSECAQMLFECSAELSVDWVRVSAQGLSAEFGEAPGSSQRVTELVNVWDRETGTVDVTATGREEEFSALSRLVRLVAQQIGLAVELKSAREVHLRYLNLRNSTATLLSLFPKVAHELTNCVNIAMMSTQNLSAVWNLLDPVLDDYALEKSLPRFGAMRFEEVRDEIPFMFDSMRDSLKQIDLTVLSLKDYLAADDAWGPVDLRTVLESALLLQAGKVSKGAARFSVDELPDLPKVHGSRKQLMQGITGIIQYVCDSCPDRHGRIRVSCSHDPGHKLVGVRVAGANSSQHWPPMSHPPLAALSPDAATKELALAAANAVAQTHGGRLTCVSLPDGDAEVALLLPACAGTKPLPEAGTPA